ncbi:hypothetical protein EJ02DRAFT_455271 [Clathrospora elynae]|uniref:Uncharacterized protein n=1 Tax=Clathrospora elynae TaxID=706981 RepID=A0A6A5SNP6_9PLEO|nr:hypothetical protein EJ02DRAFT_455271 [Clathrospora elynae]
MTCSINLSVFGYNPLILWLGYNGVLEPVCELPQALADDIVRSRTTRCDLVFHWFGRLLAVRVIDNVSPLRENNPGGLTDVVRTEHCRSCNVVRTFLFISRHIAGNVLKLLMLIFRELSGLLIIPGSLSSSAIVCRQMDVPGRSGYEQCARQA